ncbi:MAG: helix-turn-helix domain-containing protein [Clostridia bacterium]|nr:helix-turn-helix domain-containing protein [Clostridia bacterium]
MRIYKTEELIEKGRCIHVFQSAGAHENTHTHDFIELIYILSGRGREIIDGKTYEVGRGDLLFINYGSTHAFSFEEKASYINICFSPETVGENIITPENAFSLLSLTAFNEMRCDSDGGKLSFFGDERRAVEEVLRGMLREYRGRAYSWNTVMESYLNILIAYMLRKTEAGVGREEIGNTWRELSEYIDKNLNSKLTLSALAGKCFYNPSYFSRVFKEKFGMSLVEYVTRRRLDHALELLRDSELSVDEISELSGFSDRSGFYHAFSKYIGGSPSDYRSEGKVKISHKSGK